MPGTRAACHAANVRYPLDMNQEIQPETMLREIQLPEACLGCGGPVAARFTPGSARGVCLRCRAFTAMAVERHAGGFHLVQMPGGYA